MGTAYTQRSITEPWRHTKVPVDEMARVLRPCRSTIYRELKRNNFSDESMPKHDGYFGAAAQLVTADRRARDRKLIEHPELCRRVIEQISILFRPDNAAHRRQFGHWEGDLMLSKQKLGEANVTSLVERVSRFTMILKTPENAPNQ